MKVTTISLMITQLELVVVMVTVIVMVITKENVGDSPSVAVVLAVLLLGAVRKQESS